MSLSELPAEILIEIIKFSFDNLILLCDYSLVCKEWNKLINNSEELCKFLYLSFFGWRNNLTINSNAIYQLQNEIKFWNRWKFYSNNNDSFITSIKINKKQRLLSIERLDKESDKKNLITEPIFYNTGNYYFEVKCLKWNEFIDNIFVGFIYQSISKDIKTINFNGYLGSSSTNDDQGGSFGLLFPDGDVYGLYGTDTENMSYANQEIVPNTKVGVYLDSFNLLLRFVLVKEKKKFEMISLKLFMSDEDLQKFMDKTLVLYPAISILFEGGIIEINSTAGFRSIKKAQWIKDFVAK